jgi:hypothetical protein
MDAAAHQAAGVLTAEFERFRFGPPQPAMDGQDMHDDGRRTAAPGRNAAARLEALEVSLRANATLPRRLRATWLPPSVMARLGRFLAAPFTAGGRAVVATAKAAARSLHAKPR